MKNKPIPNVLAPTHLLSQEEAKSYQDKSFEEVLADMAETQKVSLASAIINQIINNNDTSSMRFLQNLLEKINVERDEIEISDERFREIIQTAASLLRD